MTTVAIHQPEYFPSLRTLHKLASADRIVFLLAPGVTFDRASCQHRSRVAAPRASGMAWRWVTIPYRHVGGPQELSAVRSTVPPSRWGPEHRRAFDAAYGSSAVWRDEVAPWLGEFFRTVEALAYPFAWEIAQVARLSTLSALAALGWARPWDTAAALGVAERDRMARLVAVCRAVSADVYLSGRTGAALLDLEQFTAAGVSVRVHDFGPFEPGGAVEPSVLHDWVVRGRERLRATLRSSEEEAE